MADISVEALERLDIPAKVRKDLEEFVTQLVALYREDLVSIMVFGSAVTGDYDEKNSDLNLLVIYSDLNIADLDAVAKLAQKWLKRRRFAPRFLSLRNLTASSRYFQIDLLDVRDAHRKVYGVNPLGGIEVRAADMAWQLAHEIKRMRMRVKQQFWRAAGDRAVMRRILLARLSSLVHLTRVLLYLRGAAPPVSQPEILKIAVQNLKLDAEFVVQMLALKKDEGRPDLNALFTGLMDAIRTIDEEVDRLEV
jgi:predicted nucleotidyltransferase